jgi:hypothetical protein
MEIAMGKIYKNTIIIGVFFTCLLGVTATVAMTNIFIKNEMSNDLFIESFQTNGSVVVNSVDLVEKCLKKDDKAATRMSISIVSSLCDKEHNSATLSIFNALLNDYETIYITWGKEGISLKDDTYVRPGAYRITQQSDGRGNVTFSFYDDSDAVKSILREAVLLKLKSIANSQQRQSEATIAKYFGITQEELGLK